MSKGIANTDASNKDFPVANIGSDDPVYLPKDDNSPGLQFENSLSSINNENFLTAIGPGGFIRVKKTGYYFVQYKCGIQCPNGAGRVGIYLNNKTNISEFQTGAYSYNGDLVYTNSSGILKLNANDEISLHGWKTSSNQVKLFNYIMKLFYLG